MKMSVRTKLCIVLAVSHLFVAFAAVLMTYYKSQAALSEEIRNQAKSLAALGAILVDGDLHESIKTREDETSEAYLTVRSDLREIRKAISLGREAKYVYTLRNSYSQPGVVEFVVDAEESHEDASHVGDVYKGNTAEPLDIGRLQVDREYSVDQWGKWLSATAPVRNSQGQVVAGLGVDIAADVIDRDLGKIAAVALIIGAIAGFCGIVFGLVIARQYTKPLLQLQNTVLAIQQGNFQARSNIRTQDEFGDVAQAVNSMASGLEEREAIKSAFARYVSQDVLQAILSSNEPPKLNGQRKHITVLFSDIRGFTSFSENLRPEEVLETLNEYFSRMIDIIHRHKGTLDKLIGDGIMAVFGAPLEDRHHEENAVRAAVEMIHALNELSGQWRVAGKPQLQIGVGINSGQAIVGNIGSPVRMEYTAIGDTVNLASRLEGATKDFGQPICISEYTYAAVKGAFPLRKLGEINIRGRKDPINVYTLDSAVLNPSSSDAGEKTVS